MRLRRAADGDAMKPLAAMIISLLLLTAASASACERLTEDAGAQRGLPVDPEQQALARNLLQLARAPGDPLSDLLLAKATCQAVGAVAAWPPRAVPGSGRADVDADAMASILLHDAEYQGVPAPLQRKLEQQLLAAAATNAYFAVSLFDPAADTGNTALLDAALKAGAAAPRYQSPFLPAVDSALDRFAASGIEDRTAAAQDGGQMRKRDDVNSAIAVAVGALPGVTGIVVACKKPTPARRADCQRLATTMLAGSTTRLEATTAAGILDAIEGDAGGSPSTRHRAPVLWLQQDAMPMATRIASLPEPHAGRLLEELRTRGELAALRAWLVMTGKSPEPPAPADP
jgi:hypothetical protein